MIVTQSEIEAVEKSIDEQEANLARDRQRLLDLRFRFHEEEEKISCPICNEPAPDGLEACAVCYNRHFDSTCKVDDIKKLLREFPASDTTEAEALIRIDIITTRGEDRK